MRSWAAALFLQSAGLLLFELLLTRLFAIVMFAQFAHLAISLALLGIGTGALAVHVFPRIAPADRLEARLSLVAALGALGMLLAVYLSVRLPFTRFEEDPFALGGGAFYNRAARLGTLVRPEMLLAVFPAMALPFACLGLTSAAVF